VAPYSAARDDLPFGVSGDIEARRKAPSSTTMTQGRSTNKRGGGTRTKNIWSMLVTEPTFQPSMAWLKAVAPYSAARDGWAYEVSGVIKARGEWTITTRRSSSNERDGGARTVNMPAMLPTELTTQVPIGLLKEVAPYSAAKDGWNERRSRSEGMGDDTATQQQHAGWRNTYREHVFHVRHLAHVPVKVLIEGGGTLQRSEGRFTVWSERY
jgi:hypothetical protein